LVDLGNTVQNARSNNLNTSFNMDMLYKYLGLTKIQNRQIDRERQRQNQVVNTNAKPQVRTMNLLMA
jgi:protein subunit release factor A